MNGRAVRTAVTRVYLSALADYEQSRADSVLFPLFEGMLADNGIENLAGKTVVIKPNLLASRDASAGITTHPSFVHSAAVFFGGRGAKVRLFDSPGGPFNEGTLNAVYKSTGMEAAVKGTSCALNYDTSSDILYDKSVSPHAFPICRALQDADIIVNLNRLKTHALCDISASVKNMFGSIPGLKKAEQHARFPSRDTFAAMLNDLCLITAPVINITDGVLGMEGNGPAGGTLKKVGAVIASANPFAADIVSAHIMGYAPTEVGTLQNAVKRGLCPSDIDGVDIIGEPVAAFTSPFIRPDGTAGGLVKQIPTIFGGKLRKIFEPRPTVDREKCIGCGKCAENCPVSTITVKNKKAHIHASKCIKCYCCQEFCPAKAIHLTAFGK